MQTSGFEKNDVFGSLSLMAKSSPMTQDSMFYGTEKTC